MWKMLIADDEAIEREAIQSLIKQNNLTFEIVAEAENGRRAIELADLYRPDVVMMDIKMPGINGLDAIKELKHRHPYTKFIIVSAYDYFEYAQEAMSLGIKYYLLKPTRKEQIIETILKVNDELNKEQRERKQDLDLKEKLKQIMPVVENEMTVSFLIDHVKTYSRKELMDWLNLSFRKGFAMIISFNEFNIDGDIILYERMKSKFKQLCQCLVSPMINKHQLVLFILDSESKDDTIPISTRTYALQLARKIINYVKVELKTDCFIAIGSECSTLDELRLSYQHAAIASENLNGTKPIIHYEDVILNQHNLEEVIYPVELERYLLESLRLLDEKRAEVIFNRFFKEITSNSKDINLVKRILSELFIVLNRACMDNGFSVYNLPGYMAFESYQTLEQLYDIAFFKIKQIFAILQEKKKTKTIPLMEKAKLYTMENYTEEITLEKVAEFIQLSSYYVSKMFKEVYGITFKDYLTKLRIEKAKELMNNTDLSIKEICYQVGYHDPNYFSRVFKKVTGWSPSEYKEEKG